MLIQDGRTGITATVTDDGHLETEARVVNVELEEMLEGRGYNFDSGSITITNATANGLLSLKNTGTNDFVVMGIRLYLGASTGGSGVATLEILKNSSAGTLYSAGTAGTPSNANFGSSLEASGTFKYAAASGQTITDGDVFKTIVLESALGEFEVPFVGIVVPTGKTLAIRYTAPSGNTSQVVLADVVFFESRLEL